ncbi:DNA-3-methyladenine glycosylase I [Caldibacillus lycopersici]|uniref:DNA-3-methyladenine glycosylase I n=1 Tax=Perspicuibacillus lycopersici TaxID=1325689 RepID=A0AAE3IQN4_9BACI|nr:DNA-3-methyladenine glycosylase I [Perspicuibacillus lycopersici]MCU9611943.1 DNA-3-methyladenine glycosylase I [Perspicuibacillus lycopersici]
MKRCQWVTENPLYIEYHDREWGIPVLEDGKLFEMLLLEGAQAGLSWITILKRRDNYRFAFDNFDYEKIATYSEEKILQLKQNEGIIRNERKIRSAVENAKQFIQIQKEFGSFSKYLWSFTNGEPIINSWNEADKIPAQTELSQKISKDLKKRGFSFVGPVIIYSFLQATGVVNDHLLSCFCHPTQKLHKQSKGKSVN